MYSYECSIPPSERDTVPASRLCARSAHSPDQQAQESMLLSQMSSKVRCEPGNLFSKPSRLSQFKSHENWSSRSRVMICVQSAIQIRGMWMYAT